MINNNKLVSVIMPANNSADFIENTIYPVSNQIYAYWELLIVDDSPTDRTVEIIKDYMQIDKRVAGNIHKNIKTTYHIFFIGIYGGFVLTDPYNIARYEFRHLRLYEEKSEE